MDKKIHILVVEDSEDDALLLIREIRQNGYEPKFERVDNPEAMNAALDEKAWHIVLADYGMPHFSGEAALELLKNRGIDLPLIIVSGKIGEEKAVSLIKAGASDCIMKGNLLRLVPAMERSFKDAETRKKQRHAEESLRQSEEKYRLLVENIDEAVYAVDVREDIFNGNLIILSGQIENITGYRQDEFINDAGLWFNFIHPEDVKQVVEDTKKIIEKKKNVTRFYRIRHKFTGEFRWLEDRIVPEIDNSGNVTGFFGVVRDITDRRQAEEAINSLAKFTSEDPNPVLRISRDKTVLYKNEAFDCLLKESGLTDADTFKLLPEGLDDLIDQALKDGQSKPMQEVSSGEKVFSYNLAPISEHGYVNLYGRNITERKRIETQLIRFHKTEALGQLARGVVHDFNNILAALSGYGNLLKMKLKKDRSSAHTIDQILALTERATGLTQNLSAFNRDRIIDPKPENLNELVKRSKKILSRIVNKHIKLKTVFTDKNLTVMIDSGQMENVLINLATNARDAMPEEGLLTIKTEPIEIGRGDVTHFSHERSGKYALMTVTDTGIGMDEKTKDKIFELFYTTKSPDKGIGIGASIVHEIIKQNNGHITVESSPGKGTAFKIYLPLTEKKVEEIRTVMPLARDEEHGTILLAEDDMEFREMIKSVLEEFSYEVIEAVDGQDAIDKFRKNRDRVRLVLLDAMMPQKNAPEVYSEAREIRPDIRAIFISGYDEEILRQRGIFIDGVTLLEKPISPQELLNKVREAIVN